MFTADPAFLTYLLEIDGIVRTTGWRSRKGKPARVLRLVETLEDNGLDTVVSAMLRGYSIDRNWLNGYFVAENEKPEEPIYDWTLNAIPTREFERKLFAMLKEYTDPNNTSTYLQEGISLEGSDEQWQIVCNMMEYVASPDDFEGKLS